MKKSPERLAQIWVFAAVAVLTLFLLIYLWVSPNVETVQTRDTSGYVTVEQVDYSESQEPEGLVRRFRFRLDDEIVYDTTLMFRYHHQEADVYLDGELVYCMHRPQDMTMVRTLGGHWAMIPLYREDVGKEVLVELRPIYGDYQEQEMYFLIGSKLSLYTDQLLNALPEILLCVANVFAGLLLLFIAGYFTIKKQNSGGLYALGTLAISLGLWNFTQTNFVLLILPEKNTFVYYVSVVMLSFSVLALSKSVQIPKKSRVQRMLDGWTLVYGLFVLWQLVMQVFGILDLRQTLKGVHGALIVTAILLLVGNVMQWRENRKTGDRRNRMDRLWLLGLGVLLDLVNYYRPVAGTRLVFVLLAVFVYVLLKGARMFSAFIRQRQALEEKETQLTLSRITTMMSQIRSHFVFNVLNAISGMCKYAPEKADETVVRFSRYLRSNIDIMEDDKNVPFSQEMERLEDYVVLEQIRFGDRIEFTADLEAEDFLIPPLILQPIVENAIKHGISKRKEGGTIHLATRETPENILITIADNGLGFPMEALDKSTSVGLRNIRFRLTHLVGGTMDIKSQLGVGTTVTLTIPKEG